MTDESVDPVTGEVGGVKAIVGEPLGSALERLVTPEAQATAERRQTASVAALAAALAKAQGEMELAKKDSANPHFQSKFSSLASCIESVRAPLAKNGLAWVQLPTSKQRSVTVETILMHASGEWVSAVFSLPVDKPTAQAFGSALSYCRRYALCSLLGIAAEDDDGEAAVGRQPSGGQVAARTGTYARPAKPDPRLTPEQNQQAEELFRSGR